jgi:hypothetical protein
MLISKELYRNRRNKNSMKELIKSLPDNEQINPLPTFSFIDTEIYWIALRS